jgi:antitoxin (DNA-binding transcriptional repressor) of toxin-antitoxin stability system
MTIIELEQLQEHLSDLVTVVRDRRDVVFVAENGRIIARIVPPELTPEEIAQSLAAFDEMDEVAAEIGARWPHGVTAVDAIDEQRR